MNYELTSAYKPTGDQPEAIAQLTEGVLQGVPAQTLLGVTGSGKTFTIANVIANINKPTLILSHNKTLAAQLYSEFKGFFPNNAVEYYVSYYDYYQPEAYLPSSVERRPRRSPRRIIRTNRRRADRLPSGRLRDHRRTRTARGHETSPPQQVRHARHRHRGVPMNVQHILNRGRQLAESLMTDQCRVTHMGKPIRFIRITWHNTTTTLHFQH